MIFFVLSRIKIKVILTISERSFVTFSIIFRDSSPFSFPFSKHCPHFCHESFTQAWRYSTRKYLDSKISMHKSHHPDILEDWDCQDSRGCEGCGTRHWLVNQEPWSGCFLVSRWWIIANIENENCIIQRVLNREHNWQSTLRRSTDTAQKYEGALVNEYAENAASRFDKTDLDNDALSSLAPVPLYLAPHLSWNLWEIFGVLSEILLKLPPDWSTRLYDGLEIICELSATKTISYSKFRAFQIYVHR